MSGKKAGPFDHRDDWIAPGVEQLGPTSLILDVGSGGLHHTTLVAAGRTLITDTI
jgi:hypothetical protein